MEGIEGEQITLGVAPRKSLNEIKADLLRIQFELESAGGEFTDEQALDLKITQEMLEDKLRAYAFIYDRNEFIVKSLKAEEARLKSKIKVYENSNQRLLDNMTDAVILFGERGFDKNKKPSNYRVKYEDILFYTKESSKVVFTDEETFDDERFVTYQNEASLKWSEWTKVIHAVEECAKTSETPEVFNQLVTKLKNAKMVKNIDKKGVASYLKELRDTNKTCDIDATLFYKDSLTWK